MGGTGADPDLAIRHLPGVGDTQRLGRGPAGGHGLVGPRPGRAGLWGAGVWPCCTIAAAGVESPRGLTWGPKPWASGGAPGGLR